MKDGINEIYFEKQCGLLFEKDLLELTGEPLEFYRAEQKAEIKRNRKGIIKKCQGVLTKLSLRACHLFFEEYEIKKIKSEVLKNAMYMRLYR